MRLGEGACSRLQQRPFSRRAGGALTRAASSPRRACREKDTMRGSAEWRMSYVLAIVVLGIVIGKMRLEIDSERRCARWHCPARGARARIAQARLKRNSALRPPRPFPCTVTVVSRLNARRSLWSVLCICRAIGGTLPRRAPRIGYRCDASILLAFNRGAPAEPGILDFAIVAGGIVEFRLQGDI